MASPDESPSAHSKLYLALMALAHHTRHEKASYAAGDRDPAKEAWSAGGIFGGE